MSDRYAPYDSCEAHDQPGECTEECLHLASLMHADDAYAGESMVYSDYLGGTSSIDVSGCHRGPSLPEQKITLDTERRMVVVSYEHPEDCGCDDDNCPAAVEEVAP